MLSSADTAGNASAFTPTSPEILRKEGNRMLNSGHYEEAIQKMSQALQLAIAEVQNEIDFSLAKYYYGYGDAIITNLTNSTEIFGDAIRQEVTDNRIQDPPESSQEEEKEPPKPDNNEIEVVQETREPQEEALDDAQLAWETMETARVICEKKLQENELPEEIRKDALQILGRVHLSLGEILVMQEKKEEALVEYDKALEIRKRIEDADSRELAEVHFNMGSVLLSIKGKEKDAKKSLSEAAYIMEKCLKKALGKPCQSEEDKRDNTNLVNRELVKKGIMDSSSIKELKEVLAGIYDKVHLFVDLD